VYEPLGVAHTAALAAWTDPELYRWIGPPPTLAQLAARIERITTVPPPPGQTWCNWVARRTGDGACVGVVETTVYPDARAHLAYFVFTSFQRQGYAREACVATIEHLRAHYGVHAIDATVDTHNVPSQRLLESLQFVRVEAPVASSIGDAPSWDYCYRLNVD
jgi:RimJ/RimL family protein N-acetyltransferase